MKLGFNATENDENQVIEPSRHFARFDISDFGSGSSEPVGSKQRELCTVISLSWWLFSVFQCYFPYFGYSVKFVVETFWELNLYRGMTRVNSFC